jgi:hypothetical protein
MGFLSDVFDFDKYNLKKMWRQIEEDPWRLLVGATTPIGSAIWGEFLDEDVEPVHNVLGGPQGSGFFGLGSGGVYDDYVADTGRDKGNAVKLHDAAEVAAGIVGLVYGIPALAGAGGGAAGGGGSSAAAGTGAGGGTTAAATSGGSTSTASASGSGGGSGFNFFGGEGTPEWLQWVQRGNQLSGLLPQQQQPAGATPGMGQHEMALMAQALRLQEQQREAAERERQYREEITNAQPIRFG